MRWPNLVLLRRVQLRTGHLTSPAARPAFGSPSSACASRSCLVLELPATPLEVAQVGEDHTQQLVGHSHGRRLVAAARASARNPARRARHVRCPGDGRDRHQPVQRCCAGSRGGLDAHVRSRHRNVAASKSSSSRAQYHRASGQAARRKRNPCSERQQDTETADTRVDRALYRFATARSDSWPQYLNGSIRHTTPVLPTWPLAQPLRRVRVDHYLAGPPAQRTSTTLPYCRLSHSQTPQDTH